MKCLGRLYNRFSPRVPILSKITFEMLCNQLGLSTTKSNRDYSKRVLPRLVPVAYLQSDLLTALLRLLCFVSCYQFGSTIRTLFYL